MFKAIIDSKSHEDGLLASFTGSSPALGSIIVTVEDGTYIGKIDAVLGNTDKPIAHIAHLDRKMNIDSFLGCEAQIRPKAQRQDKREQWSRDSDRRERHSNRDGRERRHNNNQNRSDWRDNRRDSNRRDSDRRGSRGRDFNRRDSRNNRFDNREKKIYSDNDWTCKKCGNVNFSFRKECNRCGEPRNEQSEGKRNSDRGNQQRERRPRKSDDAPRKFRKARGKSANHAHNRGPKPLNARPRRKNRDD